jgi:hypothetical protein
MDNNKLRRNYMFSLKRFSILVIMVVIITSVAFTQTGSTGARREMTVEESYLQEAIELMIIRETARADSREQKQIALEYMAEAIDRGSTNDEIRQTLTFLSEESRMAITRESARVVNNFPDIRRQAVRLLGRMGTEEARLSLLETLQHENEPAVIMEAIKALGDIGTNENNQTVQRIAWVFERFDNAHNPDNLIALATIDAFENIARVNNGLSSREVLRVLTRINEGFYVSPVKERARQLLADLRTYGN